MLGPTFHNSRYLYVLETMNNNIKFNEDILITDPCYFVKDEDWDEFIELEELGIKGILSPTLYGDWSCTVFKVDKPISIQELKAIINGRSEIVGHKIGNFCADAGYVAVASLNDVYNYNPEFFKDFFMKYWTSTVIKNFDGEISLHKIRNIGFDNLIVKGTGNINFYSLQTGL